MYKEQQQKQQPQSEQNKLFDKESISHSQYCLAYNEATKNIIEKYNKKIIETSFKKSLLKDITQGELTWTDMQNQHKNQGRLQINVTVGNTSIKLNFLFLDQNSPLSLISVDQEGGHGKIRFIEILGQQVAVKSYPINLQGSKKEWFWSQQLQIVLKQYILSFLSGKMECGPVTKAFVGFDLLVFNNQIEFFMQKCEPIKHYCQQDYNDLLFMMTQLHSMNIVHNDITPTNIMYSPSLKKLVFIDYGFSQILVQPIGKKTLTSFQGTAGYVSTEMLKLFSIDDKQEYIDLYHNDLVSLQNTHQKLLEDFRFKQQKVEYVDLLTNTFLVDEFEVSTFYHFIILQYSIIKNRKLPNQFERFKREVYRKYHPSILALLQTVNYQFFLKQYLFKELQQYSQLDSYKDLCKIVSLRENNIVKVNKHISHTILPYSWFQPSSQQYQIIFNQCLNLQMPQVNKAMLKILQSKKLFEVNKGKTMYFTILMQVLRFDCPRHSLQAKYGVAKQFLSFLGQYTQTYQIDPYQPIKKAIKYATQHFIEAFQSSQSLSNELFHTIIQAIITSTDVRDELKQLQKLLCDPSINIINHVVRLGDLFYILKLLELKYIYKAYLTYQQMKNNLLICLNALEKFILEKIQPKNVQDRLIVSILEDLVKSNKQLQTQGLNKRINEIDNDDVKAVLMKRFYYEVLKLTSGMYQSNTKQQWIIIIRYAFSNQQYMAYHSFPEEIFWKYVLTGGAGKSQELFTYQNSVKAQINCKILVSQFSIFLRGFSKIFFSASTFEKMIRNFLDSCLEGKSLGMYQKQFKHILNRLFSDPQLMKNKIYIFSSIVQYLIPQIKQQIQLIIKNEYAEDKAVRLNQTLMEITPLFYKTLLQINDNSFSPYLVQIENIMNDLYWSIICQKGAQGELSAYQCYLLKQYYRFKQQKHQEHGAYQSSLYVNELKYQLCMLSNIQLPLRKQLIFSVVKVYQIFSGFPHYKQNQQMLSTNPYIKTTLILVAKQICFSKIFQELFQQSIEISVLTIKIVLSLVRHELKQIYTIQMLLINLAQKLVHISSVQNIRFFELNISLFCQSQYSFQIKHYILIKKLKWQERFFVLYYVIALHSQTYSEQQLKLFICTAQNMYLHTWSSKELIAYIYYKNMLKFDGLKMKNLRKRRYIIRNQFCKLHPHYRIYYGYKQLQCLKQMQKICQLHKKNPNKFRKLLRQKLEIMMI